MAGSFDEPPRIPHLNQNTGKHMKTNKPLILALALSVSTCALCAQDGGPRPGGQRPGGPGGQRAPMPIIEALDLNKDGTIDADEIAKASESLKKLDKNGDGKLTPDEYRPQRPGGPGGPGRPGGPDGENRPQPPKPE